ncbi:MAG: C-GCAxxG-C-C family protein [Candidatus Thorarchaeota archaeon]
MSDETVENAHRYFDADHNCAQAVLRAVLERYGLYFDEATAVIAGMGGGIGLQGNVCGAVSGAVAAFGVLNRQRISDFKEHKEATYTSAIKFMYKFKNLHESVICETLTGIKMSDQEARKEAIDKRHFHKICPQFVEDTVKIVTEMEDKARSEWSM